VYSRSEKSAKELADAAQSTLNVKSPPDVYSDDGASLDELLARHDIAAVIVVLPINLQPSIILKALAAGKHVLSEKPVAKDVATGLELIAEYEAKYKQKNLIWRVAENYEAEPGYRRAAQAIRDGKIGDVRFFRLSAVGYVDKDSKWYKTPWRTVPDYQGGFLLDGGVHSAALLRVLIPAPFATLTSFASLSREHLLPHDTITALLSCGPPASSSKPIDKPAHGIFELSFAAPAPSRNGVGNATVVTGNKGWLQIANAKVKGADGKETSVVRVTVHTVTHEPKNEGEELKEVEEVIDEEQTSVQSEIASFLEALKGKDDGLGEPRGALKDVAIIEASLKSEGQPIDLKKLVKEE